MVQHRLALRAVRVDKPIGSDQQASGRQYIGRSLVADEGNVVGERFDSTLVECKAACDVTPACLSFSYGSFSKACYLRDKEVTMQSSAKELRDWDWHFMTYFPVDVNETVPTAVAPALKPWNDSEAVHKHDYIERTLVADEGREIYARLDVTLDECKELCDRIDTCRSLAFGFTQRSCHLKEANVTLADAARVPAYLDFKTYIKELPKAWSFKSAVFAGSWINHGTPMPVTLKTHLGGDRWMFGLVEAPYLKMVKVDITGEHTFEYVATRYDPDYSVVCAAQATFTDACFHSPSCKTLGNGKYRVEELNTPQAWNFKSAEFAGSWINHGTPMPVTLKRHLGGDHWMLGLVEAPYLKIVKVKITGEQTFEYVATRYDPHYDAVCAAQATFTATCFHSKSCVKLGNGKYSVQQFNAGSVQAPSTFGLAE